VGVNGGGGGGTFETFLPSGMSNSVALALADASNSAIAIASSFWYPALCRRDIIRCVAER
jgi:hypothetical protein